MTRIFENVFVHVTVCLLFALAILISSVAGGSLPPLGVGPVFPMESSTSTIVTRSVPGPLPIGPTVPPDPQGVIAIGPTFPPNPWEGNRVVPGPTFPPNPWEGNRVAIGPSFPPDPSEIRLAIRPSTPPSPRRVV